MSYSRHPMRRALGVVGDLLIPPKELDRLQAILYQLDWRDRYILTKRWGLGRKPPTTLRDLGRELKISYERVHRLEDRATRRVRELLCD